MTSTQRGSYKFIVKEQADGTPWIAMEPLDKGVELPDDGFLGFDLPKETNLIRAGEIAAYLNQNLSSLSLTTF